jgi:hypothetical protein
MIAQSGQESCEVFIIGHYVGQAESPPQFPVMHSDLAPISADLSDYASGSGVGPIKNKVKLLEYLPKHFLRECGHHGLGKDG